MSASLVGSEMCIRDRRLSMPKTRPTPISGNASECQCRARVCPCRKHAKAEQAAAKAEKAGAKAETHVAKALAE
eukprot:14925709-Alexandrium_andersonii.AAC.1